MNNQNVLWIMAFSIGFFYSFSGQSSGEEEKTEKRRTQPFVLKHLPIGAKDGGSVTEEDEPPCKRAGQVTPSDEEDVFLAEGSEAEQRSASLSGFSVEKRKKLKIRALDKRILNRRGSNKKASEPEEDKRPKFKRRPLKRKKQEDHSGSERSREVRGGGVCP